jgi:hypothetical protein
MKTRHGFSITLIIFAVLTLTTLSGCAMSPPAVSGASLHGAKRVAIVNIAQSEPLMLVTRNDPSGRGNVYVGAGVGGVLVGAFMAEATAINWVNNRREFNERAPANLAIDLQIKFTKSMQGEIAATGREAIIVDINAPDRADKNYSPLMIQSIREKCASCDHALIISAAFGYTKGDRVLNPTAESFHEVVRLADAAVTGFTPFLIQRDFSNSAVGHEHYNDFRNDKRDHYAPLRDLPAVAARAIAQEFR